MSAEQTTSLMQRKARNGREAYAARAMSLGRALRLTAAKQADHLMSLALGVLSVTRQSVTAEGLSERLEVPWLTMLMDGPNAQVAAVMIDPVLVGGLIQQQTMGKITPVSDSENGRAHTATDAALCAPFVEGVLQQAAHLPEEECERELLQGYRFGVMAEEPRHALLALDRSDYDVVEMTLDLAAGTRAGQLRMILPEPVAIAAVDASEDETPNRVEAGSETTLSANVMSLHAELTIALTRIKMPLQVAGAMRVGDTVPLGLSSMTEAMVLDTNGIVLSRGTLGQIDGMRALQVEQQKAGQIREPRRRASDRAELDLPDVTAAPTPTPTVAMAQPDAAQQLEVPAMSDVDIFGDMDELPDLPDVDDAEQAADAQIEAARADYVADADTDDRRAKQAGW